MSPVDALLLMSWLVAGGALGCAVARLVGRDTNDPFLAGLALVFAVVTAPVLVPLAAVGGLCWLIGRPFVKDW